jgi:hypothetical protein
MPCPECGALVLAPLSSSMPFARVDYYRCAACTHVWTTAKGSTVLLTHVTEAIKATLPSKDVRLKHPGRQAG